MEYYYTTLNKVLREPEVGVLPGLAVDSCVFCQRNERLVEQLVVGVDHYDTDPIHVVDLAPMSGAPKNQQYFSATSVQTGAWIVDKSGTRLTRDKQVRQPISIALVWGDGVWRFFGADRA